MSKIKNLIDEKIAEHVERRVQYPTTILMTDNSFRKLLIELERLGTIDFASITDFNFSAEYWKNVQYKGAKIYRSSDCNENEIIVF